MNANTGTPLNERIAASRREGVVYATPEPHVTDIEAWELTGGLLLSRGSRNQWSVSWEERNGSASSQYGADVPYVLIPLLLEMATKVKGS